MKEVLVVGIGHLYHEYRAQSFNRADSVVNFQGSYDDITITLKPENERVRFMAINQFDTGKLRGMVFDDIRFVGVPMSLLDKDLYNILRTRLNV